MIFRTAGGAMAMSNSAKLPRAHLLEQPWEQGLSEVVMLTGFSPRDLAVGSPPKPAPMMLRAT